MTGPGIFSYSTTPANNVAANTGITWDEGMSPALVNNSARQNMTDTRSAFNDLIWFKYGKGDLDYSPVYASGTTFTIAGADLTAVYHAGRRVRAVGSSTGTIYGSISSAAFSTNTTVTVVWDSGSLSNETLTISISQAPATGSPLPLQKANRYYSGAVSDPTGTASTTYVMMGLGSAWAITPKTTGRVKIYVTGRITNNLVNADSFVLGKYGTSTAPANAAAVTGTSITTSEKRVTTSGVGGNLNDFSYYGEISGLTLGTAYWLDLAVKTSAGGTAAITSMTVVIEEISA